MKPSGIRSRYLRAAWLPSLLLVLAACDDDSSTPPQLTDDIVDLVVASEDLSTLEAAVVAAGLVPALRSPGPLTVFAPVNSAFNAIDTDVLAALLEPENADLLTAILTYHVAAGGVLSSDLSDGEMVTTLQGDAVTIGVSGSGVTVDGAMVTMPDIEATNGVVHLIDQVVVPELDIVDTGIINGFLTLVELVRAADLEDALRSDNGGMGFTVFAPTEAAFAALPAVPTGQDLVDVLTYHVLAGEVGSGSLSDGQVVTTLDGSRTFTVNIDGTSVSLTDGSGATVNVVATDVPATNGIIHVIDGVLLPS